MERAQILALQQLSRRRGGKPNANGSGNELNQCACPDGMSPGCPASPDEANKLNFDGGVGVLVRFTPVLSARALKNIKRVPSAKPAPPSMVL